VLRPTPSLSAETGETDDPITVWSGQAEHDETSWISACLDHRSGGRRIAVRTPWLGRRASARHTSASTEQSGQAATEIVVLAGGCFWGVQGVFQHLKGVTNGVSGYAGGDKKTAQYEVVGSGRTGHAESVCITFDPRQISYGRILQIYFCA
jgi:hypothetical protein